ncbi:hypothetical protein F5Y08DRAFT_342609 [Xylaria arbuscula]|nr:hypothetical protein F5Y08DRAFT_342609 [Xylaria arbuscula]
MPPKPIDQGSKPTSQKWTTASQPPDSDLMTQSQNMGHLHLPVEAPPILPQFDSTVDKASSVYRPLFRNRADAEAAEAYLKSKYNVRDTTTMDIPNTDHENEGYIRMMYVAVYDMGQTLDAVGSDSHSAIFKDCYSEGSLHIVLWKLLGLIGDAQRGICRLPPWYTPEGPIYKKYGSFLDRFRDVELALRQSKAACRSLLSELDFPARLAWHPVKELRRKKDNQKINERKRIQKEEDAQASQGGNKVVKKVQPRKRPSHSQANIQPQSSRRTRKPSSRYPTAPTVAPVAAVHAPTPSQEPHGYLGPQAGPAPHPSPALQMYQSGYQPGYQPGYPTQPMPLYYQGQYPQQHYGMVQQPPQYHAQMRYQTHDPMLGANPQYHGPADANNIARFKRERDDNGESLTNALTVTAATTYEEYCHLKQQQQEHSYMDDLFSDNKPNYKLGYNNAANN